MYVTKDELGDSSGAALVGTAQAETDAVTLLLQTVFRKLLPVFPEQFGASEDPAVDSTVALQNAIDAAGNWSSAAFAREVVLTRFYKTSAPLQLRPYVSLRGIGGGRSGLVPAMTTGAAIVCDPANGTSSLFHQCLSNFRIDGSDCSGDAFALLIEGTQHGRLNFVEFWNYATTKPAVQVLGACYAIVFDQCNWLGNSSNLAITATNANAGVFPTTIDVINCTLEGGISQSGASVLIEDASGVTIERCIIQSNKNIHAINVVGGAVRTTQHVHKFLNNYFEENGNSQENAQTMRFVGQATNVVDGCQIRGNKFHGSSPQGGHIYAAYTDRLQIKDNYVAPDHSWLKDGGHNRRWDIDPRYVGLCELQTQGYGVSRVVFTDGETVTYSEGLQDFTIVKQATGTYDINLSRDMADTAQYVSASAFDSGGNPLDASAYYADANTIRVMCYSRGSAPVAANISRCFVEVSGKIVALT